jgi:hypothetical protein
LVSPYKINSLGICAPLLYKTVWNDSQNKQRFLSLNATIYTSIKLVSIPAQKGKIPKGLRFLHNRNLFTAIEYDAFLQ